MKLKIKDIELNIETTLSAKYDPYLHLIPSLEFLLWRPYNRNKLIIKLTFIQANLFIQFDFPVNESTKNKRLRRGWLSAVQSVWK